MLSQYKEVRKIQFTGKATYIISLPKEWIEEMKLDTGDPVTMIRESDNSIVMFANIVEKSPEIHETTVMLSPSDSPIDVKNKISATYLAGHNVIKIRSRSKRIGPVQRDAIRSLAKENLVGTEVISDASDAITLQVLQSVPQLSVNRAIERMRAMAAQMHKDAITSLTESDAELAQHVISSEYAVKRFELSVYRNLGLGLQNTSIRRQMGLRNPPDCVSYHMAAEGIARMAADASRIAEQVRIEKQSFPKDSKHKIAQMSEAALRSFEDSVEAVLKFDYALAVKASKHLPIIHSLAQRCASSRDACLSVVAGIMVSTAWSVNQITQAAIRLALDQFLVNPRSR